MTTSTPLGSASPYEQMTRRVEGETGTTADSWAVFDARWERVCWLTRESLGIPHEKPADHHNRRPSRRRTFTKSATALSEAA